MLGPEDAFGIALAAFFALAMLRAYYRRKGLW